jgi:hypothetical protein
MRVADQGRFEAIGRAGVAGRLRVVGLWVGWLLFATHVVVLVWVAMRADLGSTSSGLIDDSYYYLEIGRRLAAGDGVTFDGVFATNGFHPLWQAIVAMVAVVIGDPEAYVRSALLIGVGCFVVALLVLIDVVRRVVGIGPALFGALVAFHGVDRNVNGMESALSLLAVAVLVWLLVRWDARRDQASLVAAGAAGAVVVLARLDYGFVIWVLPLAVCMRSRSWRATFTLGLVVGTPLALYGLWGWVVFGNPLPVSGIAKRAWVDDFYRGEGVRDHPSWSMIPVVASQSWEYLDRMWTVASLSGAPPRFRPREPLVVLMTIGGLAVGVNGWLARRRARREGVVVPSGDPLRSSASWALVVGAVMVAGKALVDVALSPNFALAWYSAVPRVAVPMAVGVLVFLAVQWLFDRVWWLGLIALVLSAGMVVAPRFADATDGDIAQADDLRWVNPLGEAGRWIRDNGPPGRYAALDAGILGFELHDSRDHELVNIDGMVNNHDFVELVTGRSTVAERVDFADAEFLVNRADARLAGTDLSCAAVLWESNDVEGYPITVWDLRGCPYAG